MKPLRTKSLGDRYCSRELSGLHVPKLNCRIDAAGQQEAIVAREAEAVDVELVTFDREEFFAGLHIAHRSLNVNICVLFIKPNVASRGQFSVVADRERTLRGEAP